MTEPAQRTAIHKDLYSLPDGMIGEIIAGELIATPRPSARHSNAAFLLSSELGPSYRLGRGGGPGGWIILYKTEVMLGEHLLVPDLAGWRKERFPGWPKENWISAAPDWACEILSPSTARMDKVRKMPIYAGNGVSYFWLIDPMTRTLDVFRLESGHWLLLASFAGNDRICAEPFQEIEIDLENLWTD